MKTYEEIKEQIERLKERIERAKKRRIVMFPALEQLILNDNVAELRALMWVLGDTEYTIDENIRMIFEVKNEDSSN